ncbi:transporter [Arcobacter sp. CECT 8989]|uniref:TolC family protein n=1 Tax=Arcobacter sp. CECT 8989 TaxID=2044509 RepID=UPI00100A7933|nr:TolC family protein [Arcobacter sp. CECT 8989]RXK02578.1 transporter [Arcobacter sp. CECT 8989]
MHKLILYILLLSTFGFSQTISFEKALSSTIEYSKKIKQQEIEIKQKNEELKKVKSFSYGNIDLIHEASKTNHAGHVFNSKLSSREATFEDFGFSQFGQAITTEPEDLNYPDSRKNFNTKLTYSIPLFTGFKLSSQEDILSLQKKAEQIKLNIDINYLSLEVLKAYNNAVVAKEFLEASKNALIAVKKYEDTASEFYKEGLVTKIDKKQAQVKRLNTQSSFIQAKNNFELSLAYLSFLSGIENITDVKKLKKYEINKNIDTSSALEKRDEIKILKTTNNLYKKNIELNKASYYPSVYSYVEYGFNDNKITSKDEKDYYMALVGVKFTIFDETREHDLQKSKLEYKKSLLQKKELEDSIKLEVKKAKLNLNAKSKVLEEKLKAKELAYEVLEQSKLMYKNKLISMSELLKQEAIYRQNEAELILSKYENSLAMAQFNLALGNDLFKGNK